MENRKSHESQIHKEQIILRNLQQHPRLKP